MSKLGNISGKEAAKAFNKDGWVAVGQVGSHLTLSKLGERANLTVPQHKSFRSAPFAA
jgi:predicted RNA binding protein YcfA (HicA-like mRNA interferase family)